MRRRTITDSLRQPSPGVSGIKRVGITCEAVRDASIADPNPIAITAQAPTPEWDRHYCDYQSLLIPSKHILNA